MTKTNIHSMKKIVLVTALLLVQINVYTQNRISLPIDSAKLAKEIETLEKLIDRNMENKAVYFHGDDYTQFKQFHVFDLYTESCITKQEYIDYSFLNKLNFRYVPRKEWELKLWCFGCHSPFMWSLDQHLPFIQKIKRKILSTKTYLVSPEGIIEYERRLQTSGIHAYMQGLPGGYYKSLRQLGKLIADNKIDFAYSYYDHHIPVSGPHPLYLVMNDTIYLVENFGYPKDPEEDLKLSPIEDYILTLDYENICP